MGTQLVFYFIMLLVFVSYVSFIWIKYGIQSSISESYYVLPRKYSMLFTAFCWGFGLPAMIASSTALMFFAGAGICFVGAAAAFKDRMTKEVHFGGALIGITFSQAAIILNFNMPLVFVLFIAASGICFFAKVKNTTWWIELFAFSSICYVLGTILL